VQDAEARANGKTIRKKLQVRHVANRLSELVGQVELKAFFIKIQVISF
jgi:hypothetical protein